MRSSASLAMGEPVATWTSKNLRRTCAQRPASTIRPPTNKLVEPGIAVGVDDARKLLQMRLRMLALAVGRVEEQGGRRPQAGEWPARRAHRACPREDGVHSRPVLVLPVPGARTGAGVSSTCSVSPARTSVARASTSGFSAAVVAPTQPDKVEVSRLTPPRAKISAWR
jgi:hypothetical protein